MNRFVLLLNYLAIMCLLVSYLAPFVSPEKFTFIAFFGLAYPALLIINLAFAAYWLILLKGNFILSLLAILAGWFMLNNFIHFGFEDKKSDNKKGIKILSYNVKLLDFDNWNNNIPDNRTKILELIKNESADIVCLQEFYTINYPNYHFNTLDTLLELLKPVFYHYGCSLYASRNQRFGLLTISKFPIVREGKVEIKTDGTNFCIYTDIKKNADTIRIYNMHLQSIHLEGIFETLGLNLEKSFQLLNLAFSQRAPQADIIAEHIRKCNYSVIVCGDFNDTPSSYTYHKIKGKLKDAFIESGRGSGTTYAGNIPFQRIDYVFYPSTFHSRAYKIIPDKYSDHYPISTVIESPE
jgi:endonuclease/exonuclease/phosphatase family metal-dependent hydrolase